MSTTSRMIVKKDGAIGWMIFNNPERLNAVSLDMWQAVPSIIADFEADPEIKTIVLRGNVYKVYLYSDYSYTGYGFRATAVNNYIAPPAPTSAARSCASWRSATRARPPSAPSRPPSTAPSPR